MENKDFKISKIYENIADKTLSFGCKIKDDKKHNLLEDCDIIYITQEFNWVYNIAFIKNKEVKYTTVNYKNEFKIIWHPVLIWDCLSYFNQKTIWFDYTTNDILKFWTKKRKTLEMQNDDCIDYVFNLLPKE